MIKYALVSLWSEMCLLARGPLLFKLLTQIPFSRFKGQFQATQSSSTHVP